MEANGRLLSSALGWAPAARFTAAWLTAAWLAAGLAAFAQAPTLTALEPHGGQRGTAVRLTLVGSGLSGKLRLHSEAPASFTPLTPEKRDGRRIPYLVEIDLGARVGAYPLRVETDAGISNLLLFTIGPFPETVERESEAPLHLPLNDSIENAETLELPFVVNATLVGADRDFYRIRGGKGERIDIEVEARRIGSAIDPVLEVRDADGALVARNDDAPGAAPDARLSLTLPAEGDYYLIVHDTRYSTQRQNFYRLKAGRFAYADAVFPMGWQQGEPIEVELSGGNLEEPIRVKPSAGAGEVALLGLPGEAVSLPLPFIWSDSRERIEGRGPRANKLAAGVTINGRILEKGEADRYRLAVEEGQHWLIEAAAAEAGTSRLYAVLTVYDEHGKKLASAGDQEPGEQLSNLRSTNEGAGDPFLGFEVPEGVRAVEVVIEDLLGRGGRDYAYRLVARRRPPDFTLSLLTPYVNIPLGGSAQIEVNLERRGYMGAVELKIADPPAELIVQGGHIPAEFGGMTTQRDSRRGVLTLSPRPGAEPRTLDLRVYGEARLDDGAVLRREARAPGMMTSVAGKGQRPFTAPWLAEGTPARIAAAEDGVLEVLTPLSVRLIQGLSHDIRWAFTGRRAGVRPVKAVAVTNTPAVGNLRVIGRGKVKDSDTAGVFHLNTTMGTPAMKFDLVLETEINVGGRRQTISSPAITFEVVEGYAIEPPSEPPRISPGERVAISGAFRREPEFTSPVTVKAANLPLGVACSEARIEGDAERYTLDCTAEPGAEPGEYAIEIAASSVLAGRDAEAVPYNIDPVEARLIVSSE